MSAYKFRTQQEMVYCITSVDTNFPFVFNKTDIFSTVYLGNLNDFKYSDVAFLEHNEPLIKYLQSVCLEQVKPREEIETSYPKTYFHPDF